MKKTIGLGAIILMSFLGVQSASAMLTKQLDLGSTGSDVRELQTYYSADASIYPSGLVTGYFGPLTAGGTQKFQIAQGIVSSGSPESTGFGRVGPTTLARLQVLMGGSPQVSLDQSPILSNLSIVRGSTSATISWTTNVPTQGQVYYDTNPILSNEATGPHQQPYVSGALVSDSSGQISHSITIQNLSSNTTYHYLVRAVDGAGNMSMVWPSTFVTNN